ncbi:unnamed protein product [Pedinophyceae sp. YPF-701]|nr:unnamed protein product [Pedinophyceae sp. YPF-701]
MADGADMFAPEKLLRELEEAVSCPMCKGPFCTPLVLRCGHSFCSGCIRRFIQHEQSRACCPQCRQETDEESFVVNTCLAAVVRALGAARTNIAAACAAAATTPARSRKRKQRPSSGGTGSRQPADAPERARKQPTRAAARNAADKVYLEVSSGDEEAAPSGESAGAGRGRASERESGGNSGEEEEDDEDSAVIVGGGGSNAPPPPKGFVACPMCGMSVRVGLINTHVDTCLEKQGGGGGAGAAHVEHAVAAKPRAAHRGTALAKVPKRNFALDKEASLRAALGRYGLSTDGKKPVLVARYNEYRVRVQTAMDAGADKTMEEVAAEVNRADKSRGRAGPGRGLFGAGGVAGPDVAARSAEAGAKHGGKSSGSGSKVTAFGALVARTIARDNLVSMRARVEEVCTAQRAAGDVAAAAKRAYMMGRPGDVDGEEWLDHYLTGARESPGEPPAAWRGRQRSTGSDSGGGVVKFGPVEDEEELFEEGVVLSQVTAMERGLSQGAS